jgi:hypothetical protein
MRVSGLTQLTLGLAAGLAAYGLALAYGGGHLDREKLLSPFRESGHAASQPTAEPQNAR